MTSDATPSTSHIKHYRPYFTPLEVERLSAKQRGKLSVSREERARQQACGFIDAVGVRCGFPRRTIATAQTLYMRFHLFFPYKDFNYIEVALSTLYVSSKLHDTLKKPRDIILQSYPIRYPQLVKKGGTLDPASIDANVLEGERKRVLSVERLVLECVCFQFGVEGGEGLVPRIGKRMGVGKELCQHAWRVAVDCHRTPAPLSYPPHIIALGSLYTASMLLLENTQSAPTPRSDVNEHEGKTPADIVQILGSSGGWEGEYSASAGNVDAVAHTLLDFYITMLSLPSSEMTNPSTPSPVSPKDSIPSPSQNSVTNRNPASSTSTAFRLGSYWTAQSLTELKIHLREKRPGQVTVGTAGGWDGSNSVGSEAVESDVEGMGQNDGTVRFVWDKE